MAILKRKKLKRLAESRMKPAIPVAEGAKPIPAKARTNVLLAVLFSCAIAGVAIHSSEEILIPISGAIPLTVALSVVFALFIAAVDPQTLARPGLVFFVGLLLLFLAAAAKTIMRFAEVSYIMLLPLPLFSMLITLVISAPVAIFFAFSSMLWIVHLGFIENAPAHSIFQISTTLAVAAVISSLTLRPIRTRTRLMKLGLVVGLVQLTLMMAFEIMSWGGAITLSQIRHIALAPALGFANGLATAFIMTGILPFVEKLFTIVTELSLLEFGDHNQPLLRRLVLEAPGTYHHSMIAGSLAESASEAIGANSLLARVGAYYHDIGKLNKPEYFVENESSSAGSMHARLSPTMSTLIITSHAKDGEELARYYELPKPLLAFIREHHGTGVVEFFYHEALNRNKHAGNPDISRESFRYSGPAPQSKETGILLLADSVEAASRALDDPTPARLEGLVSDIITRKLVDGQLDDCGLTMKELKVIRESFVRVLAGIYHTRIKYPHQKESQEKE